MPAWDHEADAFFTDDATNDRLIVESQSTKTDIDAAVLQRRDLLERRHLQKVDLCTWEDDAEAADQFRKSVVERGSDKADIELQHRSFGDPLGHRAHLVDALQDLAPLFEQIPSWLCQRQWSAAIEQTHAQFVLELLYLAAQWRLRNVEFLGGTAEGAFRSHGGEVTQVTELHGLALQYASIPFEYRDRHNRSFASSRSGHTFLSKDSARAVDCCERDPFGSGLVEKRYASSRRCRRNRQFRSAQEGQSGVAGVAYGADRGPPTRSYEAGATLVHIHVRNDDESPSSDPDRFAVVQAGVRKHCPGMIVQFSTGGRGRDPPRAATR